MAILRQTLCLAAADEVAVADENRKQFVQFLQKPTSLSLRYFGVFPRHIRKMAPLSNDSFLDCVVVYADGEKIKRNHERMIEGPKENERKMKRRGE